MQPRLYIGGAGTGKTTACFAEIERILQDHPDHQIIVLVPDPCHVYDGAQTSGVS